MFHRPGRNGSSPSRDDLTAFAGGARAGGFNLL